MEPKAFKTRIGGTLSKSFTEADWLKELTRLSKATPEKSGYSSVKEISEALKLTSNATIAFLHKMAAENRLMPPAREKRPALDGIMRPVPCYRIKAAT
jgi:hypothetical protein